VLLYYVTDRSQFPGSEASRREQLLLKIAEAAESGVDYIQLREKDLTARELEGLAQAALQAIPHRGRTRFLINSRTDVALAAAADGVHLRSSDLLPAQVRDIWARAGDIWVRTNTGAEAAGKSRSPVTGVSCHSIGEVATAAVQRADFAVFGPVFEKKGQSAAGLGALREACRHQIPVLALGGITLENAGSCIEAGAAGIAAIRLFQQNAVADVVRALRG
jgi:thiamine-phosphate pyrophosphorylase